MLLNSDFVKGLLNKFITHAMKKKLDMDGTANINHLDIKDANENFLNIKLDICVVAKKSDVKKLITQKMQAL